MQSGHIDENKRYSILFVDDEQKSLKYFNQFFSGDFRVITTSDPLEAERILGDGGEEIAVLVTDQRMPGRLGTDLLRYARERSPRTVRILTSAYSDFQAMEEAINEGGTHHYVSKPWKRADMARQLSEWVAVYRGRGEEEALLARRRESVLSLAGNIAHELRTNLLGIEAAVSHIESVVPALLEAYEEALNRADGSAPSGRPDGEPGRRALRFGVESIHAMVKLANVAIDLLLASGRSGGIDPKRFQPLSARKCIELALERYPLHPMFRKKVRPVSGEDFHFSGVEVLFQFVIFNLLKNALYGIAAANRGDIEISLEPGPEAHRIRFRDGGCGIPEEVLPYIFDDFYSHRSTKESNGMGLPFCRRTLKSFGGTIECRSQEGAFTEFTITLPRLRN